MTFRTLDDRHRGRVDLFIALVLALLLPTNATVLMSAETRESSTGGLPSVDAVSTDFVAVPRAHGPVQFKIYTNASPDSQSLFNSFEIEAHGQSLLQTLEGKTLKGWLDSGGTREAVHQILIDGHGATLSPANGMRLMERAAGPGWEYMALDASDAYRGQLERFTRAVLFVEPDLFVLYDQVVAPAPVAFQMLLHAPADTRVDPDWGDLHLETTITNLRINTPGEQRSPRAWKKLQSGFESSIPGHATMQLEAAAKLTRYDVITVFAVYPARGKSDYAFKLLEGTTAIGARIHRAGLPTLVAFRTSPLGRPASLTGFSFDGSVGVDVFRPKFRTR